MAFKYIFLDGNLIYFPEIILSYEIVILSKFTYLL